MKIFKCKWKSLQFCELSFYFIIFNDEKSLKNSKNKLGKILPKTT